MKVAMHLPNSDGNATRFRRARSPRTGLSAQVEMGVGATAVHGLGVHQTIHQSIGVGWFVSPRLLLLISDSRHQLDGGLDTLDTQLSMLSAQYWFTGAFSLRLGAGSYDLSAYLPENPLSPTLDDFAFAEGWGGAATLVGDLGRFAPLTSSVFLEVAGARATKRYLSSHKLHMGSISFGFGVSWY